MPIDFTNKPGVSSQGSAIPEWLSPIVSGSEKKASNDQKMTKEASTEITKEMIEDMLLSNDRITRLQKGASVEKMPLLLLIHKKRRKNLLLIGAEILLATLEAQKATSLMTEIKLEMQKRISLKAKQNTPNQDLIENTM